jgi:enterochelin esterase family protein
MSHLLLEAARRGGAPVIEGGRAIFVWSGEKPPLLVGDFNGWESSAAPEWEEAGEALWTWPLDLPDDAYIEYAFRWAEGDETQFTDPLNPHNASNGVGKRNSLFYMPGSTPTPLTRRAAGVPAGALARREIEHRWLLPNGRRTVHLYRPPAPGPVPLIVVYDGNDYLRRARLPAIVDNLIAQRRIRPVALALVQNNPRTRLLEYGCSDITLAFLAECVLPLAQSELDLLDPAAKPGCHGVMGASMGGLMATYTGLRMPETFGGVLSQSGAFLGEPRPTVAEMIAAETPARPIRIWMDVGRFEWLLDGNRQMHAVLAGRGYDVAYREYNAAHNYPAWRDDLWRGLEHLFPPE